MKQCFVYILYRTCMRLTSQHASTKLLSPKLLMLPFQPSPCKQCYCLRLFVIGWRNLLEILFEVIGMMLEVVILLGQVLSFKRKREVLCLNIFISLIRPLSLSQDGILSINLRLFRSKRSLQSISVRKRSFPTCSLRGNIHCGNMTKYFKMGSLVDKQWYHYEVLGGFWKFMMRFVL